MRILCTGGGTGGTVAPLLAVAKQLQIQKPDAEILFLITRNPREREIVEAAGFSAQTFPAGKWRRYFDVRNVRDIFIIAFAYVKALAFLASWKPDVLVSVGSFLSVPVAWAAKHQSIPVVIHQQDVTPGLANRLMARAASLISVAFRETQHRFGTNSRVIWTGNPTRAEILSGNAAIAREQYNLEPGVPTVLVLGGSSGAAYFTHILKDSIDALTEFCQVVHVLGKHGSPASTRFGRYHHVEFIASGMQHVYAATDVVVTRAGLSTLSELSVLGKPSIVIPMPHTHQEQNAAYFSEHNAAVVLDQQHLTADEFVAAVRRLIADDDTRQQLGAAMKATTKPDAAQTLAREIIDIAHD